MSDTGHFQGFCRWGDRFPPAAPAPTAGELSLPALCTGSGKDTERGKTSILPLDLKRYLHGASAEAAR